VIGARRRASRRLCGSSATLLLAVATTLTLGLALATPTGAVAQSKKPAAKSAAKSASSATQKQQRDAAAEKALLRETAKVEESYLKELERVASWAASSGLKAEAEQTIASMKAISPAYAPSQKLKASVEGAKPPEDEAKRKDLTTSYAKKLEAAKEQNAKKLFSLATACMKLGLFTRAYDLIKDVIAADPDHKRARDILGYTWDSTDKKWITKWEADMRKKSFVTEEGWVKKEDKKKWDQGLREYSGKWVPKEEEERIRKRNEYNPFFVETEHYRVETNLGRKQAFEFALLLEDYYDEFFRFFLGFYDQEAGTKLLFRQANLKKKHRVKMFPSQTEYLTFVKAEKGNQQLERESGGFYAEADRCSYFFWSENREGTLSTLYHEVAHQLFAETKDGSGNSTGNNWVVEGIATYLESWEKVKDEWRPGSKFIREFQEAKSYLAADTGFKLAPFLAIDNDQFHKENRHRNYALSGALCHFLLHYDGGIYKEAFVSFLSAYYSGKVVDDSLGRAIPVEGVAPGPR
jgi:hypothetical protein